MRKCSACKEREDCIRLCPDVESILPKEETGANSHREVPMSPEEFEAVAEMYSFARWDHEETINRHPKADLSRLTSKEKQAFLLLASGLSMRAAARRLKIKLSSLQARVRSTKKRLSPCHSSHLMRDENKEASNG